MSVSADPTFEVALIMGNVHYCAKYPSIVTDYTDELCYH